METVSAPQEDSSGANPSSVKSEDSSPRASSGRGSPPPNCAICLGTCKNKSFTDSCLHQFCFTCLLTWSKVKAECPLCKQNFKSIIHNVRSNHQYEEYMVEQRQSEEVVERIDIDSFTTATRRFRYRTTLTLPRSDSEAIQQLLLHYPMVNDVLPTRAPPARRRRSPTSFRRTVYRHNLWARPLSDITGRFRNCTPEFYRYNNAQMHRLVPWLNRELHYLLNENAQHISYVMTRILELLPQYHINSVAFRDAISPYFNDRTEHFQHELYCFASTPYDMMGYDRNVQYTTDPRISTMVNEVISSSDSDSVDSDIVMISSSEPAPMPRPAATAATTTAAAAAGPSRPTAPSQAPPPYYPPNYIPNPNNSVIPIETISHSDTDDDSSEVIVVGYIKPPQDRTPEVVDLMGSDSDVVVQETPQAGPSQGAEERAPLVKLSLKRYAAADSDSSASAAAARRRRRRLDSQRLYSSTDDDDTSSYYLTESESTFNLGSSSTSLSSSPSPRETKTKKKSSKTKSKRQGTTKKHKSKSKKSHKRKRSRSPAETRRPKKKSRSDKEIKNSKRSARRETPPQPVATAQKQDDEQPSTSGVTKKHKKDSKKKDKKHRRGSAESSSKRLKSVVKVINPASESNSNSNLLNVLSDAILNPNSSVLSYNSDSGSIPCESGRGLPAELRGSVDSCFTSSAGAPASPSSSPSPGPAPAPASSAAPATSAASASAPADSDTDSEDNIPLNLTIHRT